MEDSDKANEITPDLRKSRSIHSLASTVSIPAPSFHPHQHHDSECALEDKCRCQHDVEKGVLSRQISRVSTRLTARFPGKVPRRHRRGLLAHLAVLPEIRDPYQYPRKTKWTLTFIVSLCAMAAPIGSAIIMPCLTPIGEEFNSSPTTTNLAVALYMFSMALCPLWWSSFSETLGRRTIYIASFVLFTVFAILSAESNSISMLIAMRVLSGGAAASVQAVGAGTISDFWDSEERGNAMGYFFLGPLMGPLLGPIIGGMLAEGLNWRATQWFLAIYGGVITVMLIFALPETLKAHDLLNDQAVAENHGQKESEVSAAGEVGGAVEGLKNLNTAIDATPVQTNPSQSTPVAASRYKRTIRFAKWAFLDPLKIVLLLRFPVVALAVFYASVTFGALFFLNISIQDVFSHQPYNFTVLQVGLTYLPGSIGYMVSSLLGGRWLDYIMKREAKKAGRYDQDGNLVFRPEDRMKENAWLAAFLYPAAMVWYGWTANYRVHWAAVLASNFFFGCGTMIVFALITTMLTEFLPRKASTGIACQNFIRNIFSCIGAILAHPFMKAVGSGWMCTILAIVALASGVITILVMKKFGNKWAISMDKVLEEEEKREEQKERERRRSESRVIGLAGAR